MGKCIFSNNPILPTDIVLAPAWWFHNEGITFDEDFFYHAARRVEDEQKMEKALYERWGKYGLGEDKDKELPVLGPVHLAAGYLLSEMLGCKVEYKDDKPPQNHWKKRFPELEKELLDTYYAFKGWNAEGIPTPESLHQLGLDFVSEDFMQRGITEASPEAAQK